MGLRNKTKRPHTHTNVAQVPYRRGATDKRTPRVAFPAPSARLKASGAPRAQNRAPLPPEKTQVQPGAAATALLRNVVRAQGSLFLPQSHWVQTPRSSRPVAN